MTHRHACTPSSCRWRGRPRSERRRARHGRAKRPADPRRGRTRNEMPERLQQAPRLLGSGRSKPMNIRIRVVPAVVLTWLSVAHGQATPPPSAYVMNPPDFKPPPDDGSLRRVPDSNAAFTLTQVRDLFFAPDWHPSDHPPMPDIVARGRKPDVFACGVCHRADGPGGPENSSLAGLPKAYIVQQMTDFKSGARTTSVPERLPSKLMITLSKGVTDAEIDAAAGYFSALKQRPNIRVVETDMVPKTYVTGWHLAMAATGDKEPLGQKIIEVPEELQRF